MELLLCAAQLVGLQNYIADLFGLRSSSAGSNGRTLVVGGSGASDALVAGNPFHLVAGRGSSLRRPRSYRLWRRRGLGGGLSGSCSVLLPVVLAFRAKFEEWLPAKLAHYAGGSLACRTNVSSENSAL